jgi:hypothetical protein
MSSSLADPSRKPTCTKAFHLRWWSLFAGMTETYGATETCVDLYIFINPSFIHSIPSLLQMLARLQGCSLEADEEAEDTDRPVTLNIDPAEYAAYGVSTATSLLYAQEFIFIGSGRPYQIYALIGNLLLIRSSSLTLLRKIFWRQT